MTECLSIFSGQSSTPYLFSQRQLMTLILRKLLASSSFAIASTLDKLVYKLERLITDTKAKLPQQDVDTISLLGDFEALPEVSDEWIDDEESDEDEDEKEKKALTEKDIVLMEHEKADLERFRDLAQKYIQIPRETPYLLLSRKVLK